MPPIFNEEIAEITKQRIAMARLWDDVGVAEEKEMADANVALASIMQVLTPGFKFEAGQRKPLDFIKYVFEKAGMSEDEIPDPENINKSTIFARSLMQLASQKYIEVYMQASMAAQVDFLAQRDAQKKADERSAAGAKGKKPELKLMDKKKEDPKK